MGQDAALVACANAGELTQALQILHQSVPQAAGRLRILGVARCHAAPGLSICTYKFLSIISIMPRFQVHSILLYFVRLIVS